VGGVPEAMTNIKSGDLRHRLKIEKRKSTIGTRGQSLEEWVEIGRMWAKITPMWGQELEVARRRQENVSVKIITRKQLARDMDSDYRLCHHDDIYNVGFVSEYSDELERNPTSRCKRPQQDT
jgi:SPP1 family predicted phage head-tail adaptor